MSYLLDTNPWVKYLRDPRSGVRARVSTTPAGDIRLCSVVLTELLRGALRSADPVGQRAVVDALVAPYQSHPFDDAAARTHAQIRVLLERTGQIIGPFDLMIAAIALTHSLTVVTHNTREFSRVPGLTLEDWEQP